jgi:release factor glutamine methyltransferase
MFDFIVSNPPYIPSNEKVKLGKNVTEHEPHLALFVEDNDPFIFYKKIAGFADEHLKEAGKIYVEVHEGFSEEVSLIFKERDFKTESRKDMYGRDRMVKAYK